MSSRNSFLIARNASSLIWYSCDKGWRDGVGGDGGGESSDSTLILISVGSSTVVRFEANDPYRERVYERFNASVELSTTIVYLASVQRNSTLHEIIQKNDGIEVFLFFDFLLMSMTTGLLCRSIFFFCYWRRWSRNGWRGGNIHVQRWIATFNLEEDTEAR